MSLNVHFINFQCAPEILDIFQFWYISDYLDAFLKFLAYTHTYKKFSKYSPFRLFKTRELQVINFVEDHTYCFLGVVSYFFSQLLYECNIYHTFTLVNFHLHLQLYYHFWLSWPMWIINMEPYFFGVISLGGINAHIRRS